MKISAVIPTFNSAKSLEKAIISALSQTLPVHEICVIDDGSTDKTLEVVNKFQGKIKYIKQVNSGVSAARNTGINNSAGDWIAFLDADDEWLPNKCELQKKILQRNPELKWCAGKVQVVKSGNHSIAVTSPNNKKNRQKKSDIVHFFEACLKGFFFQTSSFLISRQLFSEIGEFDQSLHVSEDRDLWWRIASQHPNIGYIPEICSRYYIDTPSSLTKINNNRSISLEVACKHLLKARNETGNALYYEKYMNLLCFHYLLRYASKEIFLSPKIIHYSENLIKISTPMRILLSGIKFFPRINRRIFVEIILYLSMRY